MPTKYKVRLCEDVYQCVAEHGPMTANEIAAELNPRYFGNLNGQRVSQYLRQLRGRGAVVMTKQVTGEPGLWSVTA